VDQEKVPRGAFARAVRERDLSAIGHLFAEDVELHTPTHPEPIVGRDSVAALFRVLAQIFEDIEILEELSTDDRFVLYFQTRVEGEPLQIVDLLSLDGQGRITTFVVTARPLDGLRALAEAIAPQRQQFRS
jgi:SnoaL-like domain